MIIYLPEDVVECLRLKVEAGECLLCDEPQPCVTGCPEQLDVATAVQIVRKAVELAPVEGGGRLVYLPHDVADSLRLKAEAGKCLICGAPQPCVQGCPMGIDVCGAMQMIAKAVVAGVPTEWDRLEPEMERDWVVG
jgi:NADPH-dependent glutamate synthase beta subunit-like oxidoreductase